MSEYVGVQRRIAGKLENLLCVMTQTLSFSTFWHCPAWTTNSKFQRETNEFTQQDKQLTCIAISTSFDFPIYTASLAVWGSQSFHSTELQNLVTWGTDREPISCSHMRFKSLSTAQLVHGDSVQGCQHKRVKVKHIAAGSQYDPKMIYSVSSLMHQLRQLPAGSNRSWGQEVEGSGVSFEDDFTKPLIATLVCLSRQSRTYKIAKYAAKLMLYLKAWTYNIF